MLAHRILLAQAYVKSNNRGKGLKNIAIAIKIQPASKIAIKSNPVFNELKELKEYKNLIQ